MSASRRAARWRTRSSCPRSGSATGVQLQRAIIDKGCVLPDDLRVGVDGDFDRQHFHVTERGVTLVTPDMLARL